MRTPPVIASAVAAAIAVVVAGAPARAQPVVEVEVTGSADDGQGARQKAIDRAFANAVRHTARGALPADLRARAKDTIERELVRRARLYIKSYRVTDSSVTDGVLRVAVLAKVDRDGIGRRLEALGLRVAASGSRPARAPDRPPVVVLVREVSGTNVDASFGSRGGSGGAAARALSAALDALGFELVSAAGVESPTSMDAAGDLPLGDVAAAQLAGQVGAGGAVVVGVRIADDGAVRATRKRGATSRATVRVIDVASGKLVGRAMLETAAVAGDAGAAAAEAAATIGREIADALAEPMIRHWPANALPAGDGGQVVVRGATRWRSVQAVVDRLRAVPGAGEVTLRRLGQGLVVLATGGNLGTDELARQLSSLSLPLGTAAVSIRGGRVELAIDGDAEGTD